MEAGLSLFDLLLVINDLEDAGSELRAKLSQDAVGLEGLNHKVLQLVHCFIFVRSFYNLCINLNYEA